jgi:excisionase family DNA binding protein
VSKAKPARALKKPAPVTALPPDFKPLAATRREAAAMLRIDVQTIDALNAAKKLKASRIGRRVLIRVSAIEAMMDANAV